MPKSNKERLQDNNDDLQNIKTQIVNLPDKSKFEIKTYNITQNGSVVLTPDNGYDGFNQVNLTINIPGGSGTSDANLVASHLLAGYSAVVAGEVINGTMVDRGSVTIIPTSNDILIPEGHYNSLFIPAINAANCANYTECSQAILNL